jgi:hypothetical protein
MRSTIGVAVLALLSASCGGKSPVAPTPPPPANVAGSWTGNLQSSNWASQAVNTLFNQSGSSVSGTWSASPNDWNGTLTGTTDAATFTGTFTISAPNALGAGPRCTGTASVNGSASGVTLRWTSPGFTGSCTGMPVGLTWNLQRR